MEWGGRTWTLRVDDQRPGLRIRGEEGVGPLLGLDGVAAVGRWAPNALSGATLVEFERRFARVEATYAPLGWGALTVRAAWSPTGEDGMDLEVQVSALSVDQLKAVEVQVLSILPEAAGARKKRWVEPRDARSAGLSYDGREPDLQGLTTLPLPGETMLVPRVLPAPWPGGGSYVEMVSPPGRRPADHRIEQMLQPGPHHPLRPFRLRPGERGRPPRAAPGALGPFGRPGGEALARFQHFLQEPLPLGT